MPEQSPDPVFSERIASARADALAGKTSAAEKKLVRLVSENRENGGRRYLNACDHLLTVLARLERHVESILLGRVILQQLEEETDRPASDAYVWVMLAQAWLEVGGQQEAQAALEAADRALARTVTKAGAQMKRHRLLVELHFCYEVGELERARRLLTQLQGSVQVEQAIVGEECFLRAQDGLLARAEGDMPRAMRLLREARELGDGMLYIEVAHHQNWVATLCLANEREQALVAADEALRFCVSSRVRDTPQAVITIVSRLAGLLSDAPVASDLVRRAVDIGADAVLRRIEELDRCLLQLPELAAPNPDDLQLLKRLRADTFARSAVLRTRVGRLLRHRAAHDSLFPLPGGSPDELLRVCAWCDRVATRDGCWLPMGEYLPGGRELAITHAMCLDCSATFLEADA